VSSVRDKKGNKNAIAHRSTNPACLTLRGLRGVIPSLASNLPTGVPLSLAAPRALLEFVGVELTERRFVNGLSYGVVEVEAVLWRGRRGVDIAVEAMNWISRSTFAPFAAQSPPLPLKMTAPSNAKVVLVTGCSTGGIGASIVEAFAQAGCTVYATARTLKSMESLSTGVLTLQLDVLQKESCEKVVQQIIAEQGRIDILVNNAGAGGAGPCLEFDIDAAAAVFAINVRPSALAHLCAHSLTLSHSSWRRCDSLSSVRRQWQPRNRVSSLTSVPSSARSLPPGLESTLRARLPFTLTLRPSAWSAPDSESRSC